MDPPTLPDLLHARAVAHDTAQLTFLRDDGSVANTISYADLLDVASEYAGRLLAAGLTQSDIVLASFTDHESHIYLFWACCLAGIPVCPLPALHPDPNQQFILFNHLQSLFHKPTLVASAETIQGVHMLVPDLKALVPEELPDAKVDTLSNYSPLAYHLLTIQCASCSLLGQLVILKLFYSGIRTSCPAYVARFVITALMRIRDS